MPSRRAKKPETHRIRLKKGDHVRVISGSHKGEEGEVLEVLRDKNRVLVSGVNVIKKAMRPTQDNPQGGFTEIEAALHVSNVQVVDPDTKKVTRISFAFDENGKKYRVAKSGARLDREDN